MRKSWLPLTLLIMLALSACQPATTVATPTAELPTATITVAAPTSEATTAELAATPEEVATVTAPSCEPYRLIDLVLPAVDENIPAPDETDWSYGPSSALVTFMEYSDFQ